MNDLLNYQIGRVGEQIPPHRLISPSEKTSNKMLVKSAEMPETCTRTI